MIIALLIATALGGTAQTVTMPAVPSTLPRSVRSALDAERAAIVTRIDAFNASTDTFNARCGSVRVGTPQHAACGSDYAAMMAAQTALEGEKKAFAVRIAAALAVPCALIEGQLERDMDAMRRQQRTNEMGFRELDEWTKANLEAEKAALMLGVKVILGRSVEFLKKRQNTAAALERLLKRFDRQMRLKGAPVDLLLEKTGHAMRGYDSARIDVLAGESIGALLDVQAAWKKFRTIVGAVANLQAESDANVKAVLNDPMFKLYAASDASMFDVARMLTNELIVSSALEEIVQTKLGPAHRVASFIVDYGYEATKWTLSYNRIVQQHKLADEQLKAVDALKLQIERTVKNLQACRASH